MVDQRILQLLAERGIKYVGRINDVLNEADDLRVLDDKLLVVAIVMYAAGLANLTKLELDDFLSLSVYAYQNVGVTHHDFEEESGQDTDAATEPETKS